MNMAQIIIIAAVALALTIGMNAASVKYYNKARRLYDSVRDGQEDYDTLKKEVEAQRAQLARNREDMEALRFQAPTDYVAECDPFSWPQGCMRVVAIHRGKGLTTVVKKFEYEYMNAEDLDFARLKANELIEKLKATEHRKEAVR